MARLLSFLASLAAFGAAVSPAAAGADQTLCGVRAEMVSKLSERFQEMPAALGVVDQNAVLEVFVSDNGTWTLLATGTDGKSCVLASGEGWESAPLVAGRDA